jgi:hypothetical protein
MHLCRFKPKLSDYLRPTSYRIELRYCHNVEAIEVIKGFYLIVFQGWLDLGKYLSFGSEARLR